MKTVGLFTKKYIHLMLTAPRKGLHDTLNRWLGAQRKFVFSWKAQKKDLKIFSRDG